jgi:hypothetical protein
MQSKIQGSYATAESCLIESNRNYGDYIESDMGLRLRTECFAILLSFLACAQALAVDDSRKNAAADRVERLYNSFPVGTDAAGREGYNAAQKAADQLKLDFLEAFQSPQRNAANQTVWEEEVAQLISDSLKYGGDRTLDAVAMYWSLTQLTLPVMRREELLAQAKAMKVTDQSGEREFNEYMAGYVAARFDSLSKLVSHYRSATDAIEGRDVPLYSEALQTELRIGELDRTSRPYRTPAPDSR